MARPQHRANGQRPIPPDRLRSQPWLHEARSRGPWQGPLCSHTAAASESNTEPCRAPRPYGAAGMVNPPMVSKALRKQEAATRAALPGSPSSAEGAEDALRAMFLGKGVSHTRQPCRQARAPFPAQPPGGLRHRGEHGRTPITETAITGQELRLPGPSSGDAFGARPCSV